MTVTSSSHNSREFELAELFFQDARAVMLGDKQRIEFDSPTFLKIIEYPSSRARFKALVREQCQNEELRDIIVTFLEDIADEASDQAEKHSTTAKLLDQSVTGTGLVAAGAGIAAILASGGVGAVVAVAGGLFSIGVGAVSASVQRQKSTKKKADSRKLSRLINDLKKSP
ncbi:hypothetical protein [Hyphococcus luteus]|uniref:Uncharacterized protein n=1 Tax=Hyphococcus luteus TaxID=2058213 RepID=A0A2S7JZ30_9PROT|nr:hypothetical protein [Marinicaulis flavus]PQA85502.1 hypothetical protein CW354_21415 [Marinicaulis flavus]